MWLVFWSLVALYFVIGAIVFITTLILSFFYKRFICAYYDPVEDFILRAMASVMWLPVLITMLMRYRDDKFT